MMNTDLTIWEAILLGVVQGATEFLPVSSSGHLLIIPALFGLEEPDLTLVTIAHLGTLLAVLVYFRRDIAEIVRGVLVGLRRRAPLAEPSSRLGWFIVLGTIPAGAAGLLFEDFFDRIFGAPTVAAFFLLVTAGLLVIGERLLSGEKVMAKISWLDALIIGVFQMLALFPGISRSGSTITGGLLRGLDRETAARFSFLLGIPAILAAGVLAGIDLFQVQASPSLLFLYAVTFVTAAITGYACIYFLLAWLKRRTLYIFAIYCAALGTLFLLLSATGQV